MDVDDTMTAISLRQIVGAILGGGNLASSWGTYMIPAAIAKRPIPAGAILTGILCILAVVCYWLSNGYCRLGTRLKGRSNRWRICSLA